MSVSNPKIRRLRKRVRQVGARLDRLQDRYEAIQDVDANDLRGLLELLVDKALDHFPELKDSDGDGEIEFDELVEAVQEALEQRADDWIDAKFKKEIADKIEKVSDVSLGLIAGAAVTIYTNTVDRLERRIARNKRLLVDLKQQLKEARSPA